MRGGEQRLPSAETASRDTEDESPAMSPPIRDNSSGNAPSTPLPDRSTMNETANQTSRITRRQALAGLATATGAATSGCISIIMPIGGGGGTSNSIAGSAIQFASHIDRITKAMATHTVTSTTGLANALSTPNAIIWIPESARIDITSFEHERIAEGVTLASNRALKGGKGGLLYCTRTEAPACLFAPYSMRLTGIRLKGPVTAYIDPPAATVNTAYGAAGVFMAGKTAIIDHCELFGWPFAAGVLGSKEVPTAGWLHHNQGHHNQVNHLGYTFELYNGLHLIEWNYFDYNRHAIAGFARRQNGYEARFNLVGPHAIMHAFDMHNLGENINGLSPTGPKGKMAGQYCNVHHNVFELTSHSAFSIQGLPRKPTRFVNNWCPPKAAVEDAGGVYLFRYEKNKVVKKNVFGSKAPGVGRHWLIKAAPIIAAALASATNAGQSGSKGRTIGRPHYTPWQPAQAVLNALPSAKDIRNISLKPVTGTGNSLQPQSTPAPSPTERTQQTATQQEHIDPITGTPLTIVG
jgi:hypothetical protein